ncbi:hypothetical protein LMG8526_1457 [Lactococcus lactis subsp. lactis]|nr:hypothetical protein LMG8526_1457 [Lactococcus lactis subsp. lactis]
MNEKLVKIYKKVGFIKSKIYDKIRAECLFLSTKVVKLLYRKIFENYSHQ